MDSIISIAIIVGVIVAIASQIFKILQEYERGVIFFLGRFQTVKGPGLIILIPFLQKMVKVDLRVMVLDVPTQDETAGQAGDVAGQLSFVIGDGSKTGWQGRIDEFAVWDGALVADEVEWLAANGLASLPVPEPASSGLVLLGLALLARTRRPTRHPQASEAR